jgi:hypothetical protein
VDPPELAPPFSVVGKPPPAATSHFPLRLYSLPREEEEEDGVFSLSLCLCV